MFCKFKHKVSATLVYLSSVKTFGAIENELWTARNRNFHKRRHFYQENNIDENFKAEKRDTNDGE